ncbi:hypothetical protein [Streptomyces sp. NBC_01601]|uniref:hypothetical protein n=1 Tax=Streptomyces sp. NBC_01601 TaxID=2975892 RepID=UPI002E2B424C|nr:hypothetical protein [Streptomyces sp. NBC_01601]
MSLPQLPLAQDIDKNPYSPHAFHNRVRKALLIAAEVRRHGVINGVLLTSEINALTHTQMAAAARRIGERAPGVTAEGSPTEDLIKKLLHAIRMVQPSGRGRNSHNTQWVPEFTDALHQAIAIAFEAFWNDFDGYPTLDKIDRLTRSNLQAIARRVRPGGRMTTQVSQRTEYLTKHLLRTIYEAQSGTAATAAPEPEPVHVQVPELTGEANLVQTLAAVVAAAKSSSTPTIVILHLPQ